MTSFLRYRKQRSVFVLVLCLIALPLLLHAYVGFAHAAIAFLNRHIVPDWYKPATF